MKVCRPEFALPVLLIDDFLLDEQADKILQECIDLKPVYMPARVFSGLTGTRVDEDYRTNEVVYLHDVFRTAQDRSDILTIMKEKIWTEECKELWHQGYLIFDIVNYCTWQEAVISRYGTSEFYKQHRDTRFDHITYRLVTIVYYVNHQPERFSGGSLTLWHKEACLKIEPKHNRAVVF